MTDRKAYIGASIFDGQYMHENKALLVSDNLIDGIVTIENIDSRYSCIALDGGILTAGFIDLQVNGGGGVLLNENPSVSGIKTICDAHLQFGTTALLPTLITDIPDLTSRAIEAAIEATQNNVPGFLGLHLEGPHISIPKKGAHSPELIRSMTDQDADELCDAKKHLENLLVTVAPESVTNDQISKLVSAGIRVSLGHSNVTSDCAKLAFETGASSVTHLYNAMSGLTHREPGIVGAALNTDDIYCGLIADGYHVNPDAINIALRMKTKKGKLFLVTDAMSTIGTDQTEFSLNGRRIERKNGRLTLTDGTLAGADLDMISAVKFMINDTNCCAEEALRMASLYPSKYLDTCSDRGHLSVGTYGDFVYLSRSFELISVWQKGRKMHQNTTNWQ